MKSEPTIRHAVSRDGTRIGYLQQGEGPGVVLVQGAMADVYRYRKLAAELATSHTVISAERRGRGLSPRPYDAGHDIARDVEDIDSLMAATGATAVFGLSSGAIITLEAARTLDRIHFAAVYEPPFYTNGISRAGVRRVNTDIERNDLPSALIDSLLTSRTGPAVLGRLPRPIARTLARVIIALEAQRPGPGARFRDLLPGIRYDFHDVAGMDGRMDSFASLDKPLLLLSGTKSPPFLRRAIRRLLATVPRGQHVEFPGLDHDGPWNAGDPKAIARTLGDFLAQHRS